MLYFIYNKPETQEGIAMAEFGRFFKAIRLKTGQSLRQFCLANGLDAGNTSKLERGKLPPPGRAVLDKYAQMLGLKEGSCRIYSTCLEQRNNNYKW